MYQQLFCPSNLLVFKGMVARTTTFAHWFARTLIGNNWSTWPKSLQRQALYTFSILRPVLIYYLMQLCHNINRVVYSYVPVAHRPLSNIVPTYLTPDVISILQEADDIVNTVRDHKTPIQGTSRWLILTRCYWNTINCNGWAKCPLSYCRLAWLIRPTNGPLPFARWSLM